MLRFINILSVCSFLFLRENVFKFEMFGKGMKFVKKGVFFILAFASILFLTGVVSAALFDSVRDASQSTLDATVAVFGPAFEIFLGDYEQNDFFFAKLLLLILLYAIINTVLRKVPQFEDKKGVNVIISLIVAIFAVRFISQNQLIYGVLLPYGTLGVALVTILPFLLFFLFINFSGFGGAGRRISWVLFGVIFLVLWVYQADNIGSIANQIYGWTLAALVIVFIFDKNIHYYFKTWEIKAFYKNANQRTIAALQAEYLNIINLDTPDARARRARIEHQLTSLGARLPP